MSYSYYYGMNSNSVSTLFSSLSSSSSSSSGISNSILSDYYSIRNGSYKKLLKAYYAKYGTDGSTSSVTSSTKTSNSVSADTTSRLSSIKSSSGSLQESATALLDKSSSKSLFKETVTKDENGNEVKSYDMDKIYDGIKSFVDSYNDTIDAAGSSNVSSIQKGMSRMISATKSNSNLLSDIGITIDKDNKLSVDESKLKSADVSTIKSLFNTSGSYGYSIFTRATEMNSNAMIEASKTNTYTSTGSYSSALSTGNLYDSLF